MSPEKTIRWAAALFAIPLAAFASGLIVNHLNSPALLIFDCIALGVTAIPIFCLVAFSSRIAAALLFLILLSVTIAISDVALFPGNHIHLFITKIKDFTILIYFVIASGFMFKAGLAAHAIHRDRFDTAKPNGPIYAVNAAAAANAKVKSTSPAIFTERRVAIFLLICGTLMWSLVVSRFVPTLHQTQMSNLPRTPPLAEFSREEQYVQKGTKYVSFRSGQNLRTVDGGGRVIAILKGGHEYFFMTRGDQLYAVNRWVGIRFGNRYWEGNPNATRVGPCMVDGIRGTEWSHPAMRYVTPRLACISNDGILLSTSQDGKVTMQLTKLVRRDIPNSMFDLPPDAKVITWVDLVRINRQSRP